MSLLHPLCHFALLVFGVAMCRSASDFKCPEQFGYYVDARDCSKYFVCVFGDALHEKCTGGLHFSLELQTCDWPRNVRCQTDPGGGFQEQAVLPTQPARPDHTTQDPLYAGSSKDDPFDPQEPSFEEAAPPIVDSQGGVHLADGGIGSLHLPPAPRSARPRAPGASRGHDFIDYTDGKSALLDAPSEHRDYGGFDVITPVKKTDHSDKKLERQLLNSDADIPFLDFESDRNSKHRGNISLPEIIFDDQPSSSYTKKEEQGKENFAVELVRVEILSDKNKLESPERSNDLSTEFSEISSDSNALNSNGDFTRLNNHLDRSPRPAKAEEISHEEKSRDNNQVESVRKDSFLNEDPAIERKKPEEVILDSSALFSDPSNDPDFGTYTGNSRQSKKIESVPDIIESPSITDIQRESDVPQRHPNMPSSPTKKKSPPKDLYDELSFGYDDFEKLKHPFTGYYSTAATETTTTPAAPRTRPTRARKSSTTTTTTTTTTTPAPIRVKTRAPVVATPATPVSRTPAPSTPSRPPSVRPTPEPLSPAQKCDPRVCLLPDCRCGGADVPGGLPPADTPQLVLLTFDDAVNDLNNDLYDELFNTGRTNPNGCPILGTFYVSHEWTDYGQVQSLYSQGHEIASHSITHSYGEKFSKSQWLREIAGQREILHRFGGVRLEDIRGMRAPFLQIGGNRMFEMLLEANFTYDSSMPVYENSPPFWPYTLDYAHAHECMIFPCPTRSFPGLWEVGLVMWVDLRGGRCSMGDACSNPPDEEAVAAMLRKNFERHYRSNRAPFGLFYHSAWFNTQHHRRGFLRFLDEILRRDDVWLVTNWQLLQWMRTPTPRQKMRDFAPFACPSAGRPPPCPSPTVCNVWYQGGVRYMKTCQPCPVKYPWLGSTGHDG